MDYKVIKKFFDPFLQRRVHPGETVDVEDKHLEAYKPYVEIPSALKEVEKKAPAIEEAMAAPPMQVTERPKKRSTKQSAPVEESPTV